MMDKLNKSNFQFIKDFVMRIFMLVLLVSLLSLLGVEIMENHNPATFAYAVMSILVASTLLPKSSKGQ
jgi:cell division protein FtsW (lipid II flippase)